MSALETFIHDTKTKGYMDQDKLIAVLKEQAAELVRLRLAIPSATPGTTPYTPSEAH